MNSVHGGLQNKASENQAADSAYDLTSLCDSLMLSWVDTPSMPETVPLAPVTSHLMSCHSLVLMGHLKISPT